METLNSFFERSCLRYPDNVAVSFMAYGDIQSQHATYQDLADRSSKVAAFLRTLCEEEQAIAIYAKQSIGLIACLLGVLEMRSFFAPVDINWPPLMACRFLLKLNVRHVLVDEQLFESFEHVLFHWRALLLDGSSVDFIRDEALSSNGFLLVHVRQPFDFKMNKLLGLAYVMQTSGTTGEPKAVKVPQKCIVPNITDLREILQITSDDVVFVASPYTFDPFIVQVFVALADGARLVIAPDYVKMVPSKLCHLFDREGVTVLQPTPSLMHYIGTDLIRSKLLCLDSSLRVLVFGGESCPSLPTLRQWRPPKSNTQLYNLYGVTEVSCWASCYRIPEDKFGIQTTGTEDQQMAASGEVVFPENLFSVDMENEVPLGAPLRDTIIEVQGEDGKIVEEGLGQIYIGGFDRVCLLGDETSLSPGTMRATGDWAYVKDRMIWYCGRRDRQVKRMGKRINLDWVEHEISEKILGSTCCLVLEKVVPRNCSRLHLFVVNKLASNDNETLELLERDIRGLLPVYARPDCIHAVSYLPMTAHGKVSKGALLAGIQRTAKPGTSDSVREFLERTWNKVLEVNHGKIRNISSAREDALITAEPREECSKVGVASVSDLALFITSGGSSLAAVRLEDSIESWITRKAKTAPDLTGLLEVILNKPFRSLCSFVESKLAAKLNDVRDVDYSIAGQHQEHRREGSGPEETNLERVSSDDVSYHQRIMRDSRGDLVEIHAPLTVKGRGSLESSDVNSGTPSLQQASHPQTKRKSMLTKKVAQEDSPVTSKRTKMQVAKAEKCACSSCQNERDDHAKGVCEYGSCFCSVRRGMKWTVCKFCKLLEEEDCSTQGRCIDRCHPQPSSCSWEPVTSLQKPSPQSPSSRLPEKETSNHISNDKRETLTAGSEIHTADSKSVQNVERSDLNLPTSLAGNGNSQVLISRKWRTCLYKCIDASPLVVYSPRRTDGEVFIGSHGHVFMCIRLSDGEVVWESEVGDRIESSAVLSSSGRCVIVGCYDGKVYVFDRFNGATLWTFQTGAAVKSSPSVDPRTGLTWVGSHDHHLYAIDVTNKQCAGAIDCGDGSCFSSPCISSQPHLVFIATLTGRLLAVHATKYTILWSQQCPKPAFASPLVLPTGVACACVDGFVYCFDFQGINLWRFKTGAPIFCSPSFVRAENSETVSGHVILGSHDHCVYCLSLGGELEWSFTTDGQVYSTPFITELNVTSRNVKHSTLCQAIYSHKRDTCNVQLVVCAFSTVGTLYVLDLQCGRVLSSYSLSGEVFSSPVVVDNQVLIGCRDDFLYSLEISMKE